MLQLLDLARENAQLKRELCRIQAEAEALQHLIAALCRAWPDMRCRTPSRKDEANGRSWEESQ
jgi:hypothetical protein